MKISLYLATFALLNNLSLAEMTEAVTEPKFIKFFEWIKQEGAVWDGIELRKESDAMRGVYATRDYKKEEEMLFVPDHLVLSYEKALASDIGQKMKAKRLVYGFYRLNSPTIVTMAVANMEMQLEGEDGPMAPHFAVQPTLDGFPVFYDEEQFKWLEGSPFEKFMRDE